MQAPSVESSTNKLAMNSTTGHVTLLQTVVLPSNSGNSKHAHRTSGELHPEHFTPIDAESGMDKKSTVVLDTRQPIHSTPAAYHEVHSTPALPIMAPRPHAVHHDSAAAAHPVKVVSAETHGITASPASAGHHHSHHGHHSHSTASHSTSAASSTSTLPTTTPLPSTASRTPALPAPAATSSNSKVTTAAPRVPTAPTLDASEADSFAPHPTAAEPTPLPLPAPAQVKPAVTSAAAKVDAPKALAAPQSSTSLQHPVDTVNRFEPPTHKTDGVKESSPLPSTNTNSVAQPSSGSAPPPLPAPTTTNSAAQSTSGAAPLPLPAPTSSSPQAPVDSEVHLMDGVHIPIPKDDKTHQVEQAYTKTEKPLHQSKEGDKEVVEVRQVWEERLDGGEWQVVRHTESLVTKKLEE